nr:MAG TPA: hypothetical protein [Caudoviricetes sp.]
MWLLILYSPIGDNIYYLYSSSFCKSSMSLCNQC